MSAARRTGTAFETGPRRNTRTPRTRKDLT